jgi:hypothetical protein
MPLFSDRVVATENLKLAERHIAEGRQRVNAQVALIVQLERRGHPVNEAKRLLQNLQRILALRVGTRDRIAEDLGEGI